MHALRRLALGVALIGFAATLPGCAVAQPVPVPYGAGAPASIPGDWQQDLAPYGSWTNLPNYGAVWYPNVAVGWRPYTYGSWGWSSAGWAWFSTEPWGFTFNYGRWAWAPIGWVWVPGFVWGPAWVNWYWGNGYVGWAPLGYYSAVPWAQFVFIRDYDFNCDNVHKKYYNHPPKGGGYHHGPPPPAHIDRVARQPIVRVSPSQLPNRWFPQRHAGVPRAQSPGSQSPGSSVGPSGTTPFARPRSNGQPRDRAATPEGGARSFAPRPESGGATRSPYAPSPPRWNAPYGRPPSVTSQEPAVRPPAMQPPERGGPYPGQPERVPQPAPRMAPPVYSSPRAAPPAQSAPRMAPPASQAPRMAPPMQAAPRMAPPASAVPPPSAPRGQFAPSPPVTGGGRGFGQDRGFYSPGMR